MLTRTIKRRIERKRQEETLAQYPAALRAAVDAYWPDEHWWIEQYPFMKVKK